MKINRIVAITMLLLNKDKVTAKELAERFEVSTRTIYRDIESLSMSGVPIYMSKGKGGGISILEDYTINKTLLNDTDKQSLLMTLKTMQATKLPEVDSTMEKISSLFMKSPDDWVEIDFTHWGSSPSENNRFNIIKRAILNGCLISFDYINSLGNRTNRTIEPMKLIYKGRAWYLLGYCRLKEDFRMFRISRIKGVIDKSESFSRKPLPITSTSNVRAEGEIEVVRLRLRFKSNVLYRIYDDFEDNSIIKNNDDTYDVITSFPEDEWLYGYILSYGRDVEVIEPLYIKDIIIDRLKEALKVYNKYF